jgi:putative transposase
MARLKRIVVPGLPHHVTQRGVRRCDTFVDPQDREVYARLLLSSCQEYSLAVHAYCWMTNHVHLIAVPQYETSLAFVLRDTSGLYALYFNRKYGFSGHLWQARFYSCVLDESHYWSAIRYVERNPVRARMIARAQDYSWSSAAAHCLYREDPLLTPLEPLPQLIPGWSEWLVGEEDPAELKAIRENTGTGRPLGSKEFLEQLEARLGRPVTPQKRGRKPQTPTSEPPLE